jgi:hypothetical protein
MEWLQTGFTLVIGFIGHLQNETTNNLDCLTELHTPRIIGNTAHMQSSQFAISSPVVTSLQILTVSYAPALTFLATGCCLNLLSTLLIAISRLNWTIDSSYPAYNISAWTAQKTSPNSAPIFACVTVTALPSLDRYLKAIT